MKYTIELTQEEFKAISRLVLENQNSAKLQKLTHLSYLDSINLRNKLYKAEEKKQ